MRLPTCLLLLLPLLAAAQPADLTVTKPREWIDPGTGHRVIRISDEDNSQSLYFHYNSYTEAGDKMIFGAPSGLWTVDLKSLGTGTPKLEWVVDGRSTRVSPVQMAYHSRNAYYTSGGVLYAVNIDTKASHPVYSGTPLAINSDETFVVTIQNQTDPTGHVQPPTPPTLIPQRERMFGDKLKAGIALTPDEEYAANKEDGLAPPPAQPVVHGFHLHQPSDGHPDHRRLPIRLD